MTISGFILGCVLASIIYDFIVKPFLAGVLVLLMAVIAHAKK